MKLGIGETMNVVVVSMTIVFLLLTFLMLVINFQSYLLKDKRKKDNVEEIEQSPIIAEVEEEISNEDDLEVVAAIMAALSATMDVPQERLMIKSIKRIDGNKSTWAEASIRK